MIEHVPKLLNLLALALASSTAVFAVLGLQNLRSSKQSAEADTTRRPLSKHLRRALLGSSSAGTSNVASAFALRSKRLVADVRLSRGAADLAVADLDVLLRGLIDAKGALPYLVGVNKGGALVANFLAHRLNLHEKYLIKCDYRTTGYEKLWCEDRPVDSYIVVVDDVTRTGKTLEKVRSHLSIRYPSTEIFVVCLVYVSEGRVETNKLVDFFSWQASSRYIGMPWEASSDSEAAGFFDDLEIDQLAGSVRELPQGSRVDSDASDQKPDA